MTHLLLTAVFAVSRSILSPGIFEWLAALTMFQYIEVLVGMVALVVLIGAGWVLFQVMAQQSRLLLRLEVLDVKIANYNVTPMLASSTQPAANHSADSLANTSPFSLAPPSEASISSVLFENRGLASTQPSEAEEDIELTIGMATYNDFDGVYFTLQALRLYQDLEQTELLVIDNYGCDHTRNLVESWLKGRYIRATDVVGTAAPRELVFRHARGKVVLCCDSHVLFAPGVIARLKQFYREHPDCQDLLQGPLLYDDGNLVATHFDPVWREQMWGIWATDPRGQDPEGEPFDIPMQGLGVFSCRKAAWLGFHPQFRGFGGEEGYIHEKFRQAGRRCLCLPWLRWMHRFGRPSGVQYPLTVEDKLRNYVIGHAALGLNLAQVQEHFSQYLPQERVLAITEEALGRPWASASLVCEGMGVSHI